MSNPTWWDLLLFNTPDKPSEVSPHEMLIRTLSRVPSHYQHTVKNRNLTLTFYFPFFSSTLKHAYVPGQPQPEGSGDGCMRSRTKSRPHPTHPTHTLLPEVQ